MPNTIRTQSELLELFRDNTRQEISEQDLRDFVVSTRLDSVATHLSATNNPHNVTASQIGALTAISGDASPTLGGNLNLGGYNIGSVTPTELGYLSGVTSAIQTQIGNKQATITGAATTVTSSDLTASRAMVSDGSGKIAISSVTSTELGYLSGVTSAIQTQLNAKVSSSALNVTGIVVQTAPSTFAGRSIAGTTNQITVSNGNGISANPTISLPTQIQVDQSGASRGVNSIDFQSSRSDGFQVASGARSFVAGGLNNTTSGTASFACGLGNTASGNYSACVNASNQALGSYAFASGTTSRAVGDASTAMGDECIANGTASHAEGHQTVAGLSGSGVAAHAEGHATVARGNGSHSQGFADYDNGYDVYGVIDAVGTGSFAGGYTGSNDGAYGTIQASGTGSTALGTAESDSSISSSGPGSLALGCVTNESNLVANNNGAVCLGFFDNSSSGSATGSGAFVRANCDNGSIVTASGDGSCVMVYSDAGQSATAAGNGAMIFGSPQVNMQANGTAALLHGIGGTANQENQYVHGGLNSFQYSRFILSGAGTSLYNLTNNALEVSISSYKIATFRALIVAKSSAFDSFAGYEITGVVKRGANPDSTEILGTTSKTVLFETTSGWDASVTVDTVNGAIRISIDSGGTYTFSGAVLELSEIG